ncbi:MAG: aminotransferase class I/II-fold pyridoxal phosphate-dependent enzyme [Ignavibacteria bacterium]|nr:aminotransferase class I/II-fold pyridoxal phosphate-dependent enzyme [Ignavibacteria bacterium]
MSGRVKRSEFMLWAKTEGRATYHLGSSGLANYPLSGLPVLLEDLEITGNGFYGYGPLQREIGMKYGIPQEKIFSTIGTSLANHIAMATIIEPGDEVLIEHPTYELLLSTARYIGANVRRFHRRFENRFRIDTRELSTLVTPDTRLIVLTNLHNPSSVHTDEETLKEIGRIAQRVGAHVLVDEVYLDAAFDLSPRSSIHLGKEFIVTNSLTKVYGLSGLRCGWVLAEPELVTAMWRLKDLFEVNHAHPAERLSVIAFQHLDRIAATARSLLTANHGIVNRFLAVRDDIECVKPDYGTVIFPKLKTGDVGTLYSLLSKRYETSIAPGKFFEMPAHFRIGLGLSTEVFQEGLQRLRRALDEIVATKR